MLQPAKLGSVDNKLLLGIASFALFYGKGHLYEKKKIVKMNNILYIYLHVYCKPFTTFLTKARPIKIIRRGTLTSLQIIFFFFFIVIMKKYQSHDEYF